MNRGRPSSVLYHESRKRGRLCTHARTRAQERHAARVLAEAFTSLCAGTCACAHALAHVRVAPWLSAAVERSRGWHRFERVLPLPPPST